MYKRQFWQDHVTEFENRFRESQNPDGSITHTPEEGEVIQEGTAQSAKNFNNNEEGTFAANELAAEAVRLLRIHQQVLGGVKGERGTVALTNSLVYPFNNSTQSVPIVETRDTTDYSVDVDATAPPGGSGIGRVVVFDKLINGFKIAFTGGAATVTANYVVRGGSL